MQNHTTETLSEHDLEALVTLMADNPEFAAKLADAISERLDKKYGWNQGCMRDKVEEMSGKLNAVSQDSKRQFDTLCNNFEMLGDRQTLFEREMRSVNNSLQEIKDSLRKYR